MTINIRVDVDDSEVQKWLRDLVRDEIPFVTAVAINETTKVVQEEQRQHQREIFEVRNTRFVDRAVKITPFANKRSLFAEIAIDPPGGEARASVLTKFEDQREKRPFDGGSIAVPTKSVTRTSTGRVRANFRRALDPTTPHTFVKPGRGGARLLFKRQGRGRRDLKLLFVLRPRVGIRPELDFEERVRGVVARDFGREWRRAFQRYL